SPEGYSVVPESLTFNTMESEKTGDLVTAAASIYPFASAAEMNLGIAELFADMMIGNGETDGIYTSLKTAGAEAFGFSEVNGSVCFEIYDDSIYTVYSVSYTDSSGAENPNPTEFRVNNGIIVLADLQKNGYEFEGWYTLIVGGEKVTEIDAASAVNYTLFSRWSIITYDITYVLGGVSNNPLNPESYTVESPAVVLLPPSEREYYDFIGWQSDGEAIETIESGSFGDLTLVAVWRPVEFGVSYELHGAVNAESNPAVYTVESEFTLEDPVKNGYEFTGWSGTSIDGTDKDVTVSAGSHGARAYEAHFEIITYEITYDLNGGVLEHDNPLTYTVETDDFTLNNPEKQYKDFVGWTVNGSVASAHYTVGKGTYGNLHAVAVFSDTLKEVTFVVGGSTVATEEAGMGSDLNATLISSLFVPEDLGMSGYSVNKWYTDPAMTQEFTGMVLLENYALYGEWSYFFDKIRFAPYLQKFNAARENGTALEINDRAELIAYVEYVRFYDVTDEVKLSLRYPYGSSVSDEIQTAINEQKTTADFHTDYIPGYGTSGGYGYIKYNEHTRTDLATQTLDTEKTEVYAQQDYALKLSLPASPRAADYDGFKINNVEKTIEVSDSEQLWYVIEQGYRPICVAGSRAEAVYNKAKDVLRRIVTDDMTDVMKLRAIYEWLIYNVQYDNYALNYALEPSTDLSTLRNYKSWALEGVFDDGVAVCEGFAKSLITLAKTEGIPAIYVTGNGHAWNRVYVGGAWYGFDATHGNVLVDEYECFTLTAFLFTDEYKTDKGYTSEDFAEFAAVTEYNYFAVAGYEIDGESFDLFIEGSYDELDLLIKYVKNYITDHSEDIVCDYAVFEFATPSALNEFKFSAAMSLNGYLTGYTRLETARDSCGNYVYGILIRI
ncbi:MAG: InlB B-repeat-containing protein, partial [Clostridia bacterium]|nr:InlB B-repeat-containing protein [Clostridia bacterium]